MRPANNEVSVVTKTYDFLTWLLPHLARFPKAHRFTLGDKIEVAAIELLTLLVEASYVQEKKQLLANASVRLETMRYLVRLAKDTKALAIPQYAFASEAIATLGKEIGGWTRQQKRRGSAE